MYGAGSDLISPSSYVHRRDPLVIGGSIAMHPICVCNVDDFLIRRETDPIWSSKSIGHGSNTAVRWIPPVNLTGQAGFRTIALLEAIDGISKPDRPIRMDYNIIDRIKRAAVEVPFQEL